MEMSMPRTYLHVRTHYDEHQFRDKVDTALQSVRRILDSTKNPQLAAAEIAHSYDDKFTLAEFVCNVGLAAQLNCLEKIGVDAAELRTITRWAAQRSVTLRFSGHEECRFNRTESREVTPQHRVVETVSSGPVTVHQREVTVCSAVNEHFWSCTSTWELTVFVGSGNALSSESISLWCRVGRCEIKTTGDHQHTPRPEKLSPPALDIDLTWLLQQLSQEHECQFKINRASASCRTPRRNDEVDTALTFFHHLSVWAANVHSYLSKNIMPAEMPDLTANTSSIFVPVLPLFQDTRSSHATQEAAAVTDAVRHPSDALEEAAGAGEVSLATLVAQPLESPWGGGPLLPWGDFNLLLLEQRRSITAACALITAAYPDEGAAALNSVAEVRLIALAKHSLDISTQVRDSLDFIEAMLTQQLTAAIGKQLSTADFDTYMVYHNKKLFKPDFVPVPFCFDVRRPGHAPDGTVSIETTPPPKRGTSDAFGRCEGTTNSQPVNTIAALLPQSDIPMSFAISASTRVTFMGKRRLHALVAQQFGEEAPAPLSLVARARQFSSFLLLVGKMGASDSFEPAAAIILQNKDELKIPLLLEQLPTPRAFRDAIESLR